jgi:serine/threonine-protein kinase HipA
MNAAYVKIWGQRVGAIAWDAEQRLATFEYDINFKKLEWDLSPLKMPIQSNARIFQFPELRAGALSEFDTFKGLPGLLADVLPDKYGSQLINAWLATNGRPQNSLNPVEMLCFIGTRGMGALEFEPTQLTENKRAFQVELESLVETAKHVLNEKSQFHSKLKSDDLKSMQDILRIGTSAGGARPKAVIAYNERTGEVRSGQTKAPKGFEHWLIKLDGVSDVQLGKSKGYGRVEMAYYNMATDCGIHMMPSMLLEENGRAHFLTKRFDREGSEVKHHVQTFCAMNHFDFNEVNSYSYEQLFQTMRELRLSYAEAEQMFRRMVFNVLARNFDDHTKNFAFCLKQGGSWELAPAYDICHAYAPNHQWVSQHALSINGKRTNITRQDLLAIGASIRCKKASHIIEDIQSIVQCWPSYAKAVGVSPKLRDAIYATFELQ